MRILNMYTHPTHGKCYLWEKAPMEYVLGLVNTNFMKFSGYLLEEVTPKIEARGFTLIPWDWKAQ